MSAAVQIALGMLRAKNPQLAQKVEAEISKYPNSVDGIKQAVKNFGGHAFVDSAYNFAISNPKARGVLDALNRFGITPDALKDQVTRAIDVRATSAARPEQIASGSMSSYQERLNRLK